MEVVFADLHRSCAKVRPAIYLGTSKKKCTSAKNIAGTCAVVPGSGAHGLNTSKPAIRIDVDHQACPAPLNDRGKSLLIEQMMIEAPGDCVDKERGSRYLGIGVV